MSCLFLNITVWQCDCSTFFYVRLLLYSDKIDSNDGGGCSRLDLNEREGVREEKKKNEGEKSMIT